MSVRGSVPRKKAAAVEGGTAGTKATRMLAFARKIIETAPVGLVTYDATGQCVSANEAAATATDATVGQLLAQNFRRIDSWKRSGLLVAAEETLATGRGRQLEPHLVTSFGRDAWLDFRLEAFGANGERHLLVAVTDRSARRQAQDASRSAKAFLAGIIDKLADPVFVKDDQRRFVLVNDALCTQVGRSREELLGRDGDDWFPADQVAVFREVDTRVLDTGEENVNEESLSNLSTGDVRTIVTRKTRYTDPAGNKFIIGVIRDFTDRKRAETTLAASEMRYRRLFEAARDGILILDAGTGKIVDANPYMVELTGYSREEFLGRHLWEIGPFQDSAASRDAFSELQAEEYVRYDDLPLRSRDGRTIAVEFVSNVYLVDDRKVIQCNIRDVSERKRAGQERAQLRDQLRAAQKMEAIGNLASGVAHDFNNLLSLILSYAGFALDRLPKGDPIRDDILQVKRAGERAAVLTRQLLAFGRKQVLQPVPLDLNRVLAEMEKALRRIIGEDIDLARVEVADLGLVTADPGQVEQVIMNLVVNARDAMPDGGKLTIETSNIEIDGEYAARHVAVAPGPYVLLTVSDTGCGMDEETKGRIFEPFFTTKEKGKGTGLGLSMVYGIVTQSRGNIWVYSEPGKGTTFKVYLPRELSATAAAIVKPPMVPRHTTGTGTILVVEDEAALREVARRTLAAAGYEVLTAADGEAALRTSATHGGDIHLLVTDVVMPGMNGAKLARQLHETRPTTKVLYMSGYTDDAIVHHGVLVAGTQFLSKPFTAIDLTWKVREVLDGDLTRPADGPPWENRPEQEPAEPPLDNDAVRALPGEVLGKLRRAVAAARYDDVVELVETVRGTQGEVAVGLRRLADAFDYDGLRNLLGR
ncbi:MAG: PAS domain S-box protein [Deltaproteobacteria bacterium]|nr:PAS domain S-box protein [Deltaproteobacteria bacterium]